MLQLSSLPAQRGQGCRGSSSPLLLSATHPSTPNPISLAHFTSSLGDFHGPDSSPSGPLPRAAAQPPVPIPLRLLGPQALGGGDA